MADYTALSPRYCLDQMADALSKMQAAQARFAAVAEAYSGTQATVTLDDIAAGNDPRLRAAIADTGYYERQAHLWADAAQALLAALNRYGPGGGI